MCVNSLAHSEQQISPDLRTLIDSLTCLPQGERATIIAHLENLLAMSPVKRDAILTITEQSP